MMSKTMDELAHALEHAFVPASAADFDGAVAIATTEEPPKVLAYHIHSGTLAPLATEAPVDFTIYFDSPALAQKILLEGANPIEAFMAGQFKADGYLMWVFAVLAMFRG